MIPRQPCSTLFPYTTLFRSGGMLISSLAEVKRRGGDTRTLGLYGQELIHITAESARISADRKSTRLNSSHTVISYAVFCLKKKKKSYKQSDYERIITTTTSW